eukprot:TRINITY_DN15308_c0_g2_i1.p1 TRINITY_DN15308_c0_g2~~TRINITY_DN15308_c0_g2_i1.p1  ORF type:complete len:151 (+),score=27.50 TRINITY_DN15308_c0_g2_i1:62-454(+)
MAAAATEGAAAAAGPQLRLLNPVAVAGLLRHVHSPAPLPPGALVTTPPEVLAQLERETAAFVHRVAELACRLARHRGGSALEERDLALALEQVAGTHAAGLGQPWGAGAALPTRAAVPGQAPPAHMPSLL